MRMVVASLDATLRTKFMSSVIFGETLTTLSYPEALPGAAEISGHSQRESGGDCGARSAGQLFYRPEGGGLSHTAAPRRYRPAEHATRLHRGRCRIDARRAASLSQWKAGGRGELRRNVGSGDMVISGGTRKIRPVADSQ